MHKSLAYASVFKDIKTYTDKTSYVDEPHASCVMVQF